jgi:hypothetical protein
MLQHIQLSIAGLALKSIRNVELISSTEVMATKKDSIAQFFRYKDLKHGLEVAIRDHFIYLKIRYPGFDLPIWTQIATEFKYGGEGQKLSEIDFGADIEELIKEAHEKAVPFESPNICPMIRQAMLVYIPNRIVGWAFKAEQREELYQMASHASQLLRQKPVNLQTLSRRLLFERIAWMSADNRNMKNQALDDYWRTTQLLLDLRPTDNTLPMNPASLDRGPAPANELANARLAKDMWQYEETLNNTRLQMFVERMGLAKELNPRIEIFQTK